MTNTMRHLTVRGELQSYRTRLKRLRWIGGGATVLAASSALPHLLSQNAPSTGLRIVVALVTGVMAVAAVMAARATQSRLAEFEWTMAGLAEQARDLKERAATDPTARLEYVAYLQDTRDELQSMPDRPELRRHITKNQLVPALEVIDAEIRTYEKAIGPDTALPGSPAGTP